MKGATDKILNMLQNKVYIQLSIHLKYNDSVDVGDAMQVGDVMEAGDVMQVGDVMEASGVVKVVKFRRCRQPISCFLTPAKCLFTFKMRAVSLHSRSAAISMK